MSSSSRTDLLRDSAAGVYLSEALSPPIYDPILPIVPNPYTLYTVYHRLNMEVDFQILFGLHVT